MMNAEDMPRMLANSAIEYRTDVRSAFQTGLVYGIVFCDWFTPGFLDAWKTKDGLEEKLVQLAREESARNLKRGYPLAFQLENPPS
jgi:hypothetical protein